MFFKTVFFLFPLFFLDVVGTDALPPSPDALSKFSKGVDLLRHPIRKLIVERRPDCIVSDWILLWAADLADSLSIPHFRLSHCSSFLEAVVDSIRMAGALGDVVRPAGLPHPLRFTREELPYNVRFPGFLERTREAQRKSCGVIMNSFDELEPEYVEHRRNVNITGGPMNVWSIGPVQLYKSLAADDWGVSTAVKGWLDTKPPASVVYISFGSEGRFGREQLREIAVGLRSCEHPFIWVVRGAETMDEWLPAGFGEGVGDRGMVLTEWAPQVAILNHPAVGGFVTHCGWNSTLEAVCAGVPVIAWPLQADQFINETHLVQVLRMGVRILEGPEMRSSEAEWKGIVRGELIGNAMHRLMDGGDGEAMGLRAAAYKYKELARSAMECGGSSYVNLGSVIDHMTLLVKEKSQ